MTAADLLLARLERVRATGPDSWVASCPAHEDRRPSLSVRQAGDRALVHCWGGCGAADVVAAVGLSLADLFDRQPEIETPTRRYRPPLPSSRELVALLEHDLAVIDVACGKLTRGAATFSGDDLETLLSAVADVRRVLDLAHAYR